MTDFHQTVSDPQVPAVIHVDALPQGTRLDEFEVLSLLGVGGFGMVYRAYDHSLHRTVAIKEYIPSALAGRSGGLKVAVRSSGDQPTFLAGLKSFIAEARLLAQFDHPSLVKVYRFWEANSTAYMVMPLYHGMTFRQARKLMQSPPPEDWLRKVLWSIVEALKVLHENKTVHRDVSPDNIFLQNVGPPVLLDLGAARRAISDKSQIYTAILKVNYAPIEQYAEAEDLRQGPWSDLYSLAAVVHGCLCNEPPLPATSRIVRDRLPSFASVAKTVEAHFGRTYSPEFVGAISHALAILPGQRPQSVQEFCSEMALKAPDGMLKFEWRAGLPDLAPSSDSTPSSRSQSGPVATLDLNIEWAPTMAPDAVGHDAEDMTRPPVRTSNSRKMGALVLAATLLLSVVAFLSLRPMEQMDKPVVSAPMGQSVDTAVVPPPVADPEVAAGAPAPKAAAPDSKAGPGSPTPKAAMSGAKAPTHTGALDTADPGVASSTSRKSAVHPPKSVPTEAKTDAKSEPKSEARIDAKRDNPPRAASAAPSEPKSQGGPESKTVRAETKPATENGRRVEPEICADSNFITRPMCIHVECKQPQNKALAVCIEDRKHYPDN